MLVKKKNDCPRRLSPVKKRTQPLSLLFVKARSFRLRRNRLQTLIEPCQRHNKKKFFLNLASFSFSFTFINGGCVHLSNRKEQTRFDDGCPDPLPPLPGHLPARHQCPHPGRVEAQAGTWPGSKTVVPWESTHPAQGNNAAIGYTLDCSPSFSLHN